MKRNVQKFHVLTEKENIEKNIEKKSYLQRGNDSKSLFTRSSGPFPWLPFTFPADVCRFFTPRLFGCSPPPSPPASSPPLKSRPPSRPSSSCLACLKKRWTVEQHDHNPVRSRHRRTYLVCQSWGIFQSSVFFVSLFLHLPKPARFGESSNHDW